MWGGASFTSRLLLIPIVKEAGWAPVMVCAISGNIAPTGIRSPDSVACSQSLYQLSYPTLNNKEYHEYFVGIKGLHIIAVTLTLK